MLLRARRGCSTPCTAQPCMRAAATTPRQPHRAAPPTPPTPPRTFPPPPPLRAAALARSPRRAWDAWLGAPRWHWALSPPLRWRWGAASWRCSTRASPTCACWACAWRRGAAVAWPAAPHSCRCAACRQSSFTRHVLGRATAAAAAAAADVAGSAQGMLGDGAQAAAWHPCCLAAAACEDGWGVRGQHPAQRLQPDSLPPSAPRPAPCRM